MKDVFVGNSIWHLAWRTRCPFLVVSGTNSLTFFFSNERLNKLATEHTREEEKLDNVNR